jgi:hypothetical protein
MRIVVDTFSNLAIISCALQYPPSPSEYVTKKWLCVICWCQLMQ